MKLKKFSDFSGEESLEKNNPPKVDLDKIELKEIVGEESDKTEEELEDDKEPVTEDEKSEENKKKEEELEENFQIEILEDNIIKFNNGLIKRIYELLSEKYSNMDYFIRSKGNDLHVVKYNEKLNLNINEFVSSLFKFYSTSKQLKPLTNNVKIKGNHKFSVIENLNPKINEKVVNDLSKLLSKKKEIL